tara:strand:- start:2351 stop:3121 length:771 start_codon:yes stop_codon:yes gene_type:complete
MIGTVHQLYFLPWIGYFSKLYFSDSFVVFDTADFRKRHFYDRVKIIDTHGKPNYISLPAGQNYKIGCNNVTIKDIGNQMREKIIRTIQESYANARFYDSEWKQLKKIISNSLYYSNNLTEINYQLIANIFEYLGLRMPKVFFTSELDLKYHDATEMLIQICKLLDMNSLLLGDGKSTEIHDLEKIKDNDIQIYIQEYKTLHPVYEQSRRKHAGFVPCLSIVDSILNVGREKTSDFISNKKYEPQIHKLKNVNLKKS